VCAAMAWYSYGLVQIDFSGGSPAASLAIPAWIPETILPFAFALMALRFMLRAFSPPAIAPALLHDPGQAQA